MAHLYALKIDNYRGIKHFEDTFGNTKFVVLIGRGDAGKTTILRAISSVLSPSWNLSFNDWDFYACNTEEPIVIEAIVKDLPDELLTQNKYGLRLGLLNNEGIITYNIEDIPEEESRNYEKILTIRLTVNDNLEPKWVVISGPKHDIETEISASDRAKLKMFQISDYIDNHFSYSKGSPLYSLFRQNIKDTKAPEKKIIEMVRRSYEAIRKDNSFGEFDKVQGTIITLAKAIGLTISDLSTLLEFKENAYTESNITLHSDNIPYRLHGKGSKRLLSIAVQQGLVEDGGIVLIDELEQGLEPDRSRNLARLLKQSQKGQVFVTTHSREVVAEVETRNLFLLKRDAAKMEVFDEKCQGMLRRIPESVLAKRVICCEGSTEVGIVRAFDNHLLSSEGLGLTALGIVYVNCQGGDKFYKDAIHLKKRGIDACVMADDDTNKDLEKAKKAAEKYKVDGVLCDKGKAIEDMLFLYLPWRAVLDMIKYAEKIHGDKAIFPILTYSDYSEIEVIKDDKQMHLVRQVCATKAKEGSWYKRIDHGEFLGSVWIDNITLLDINCGLVKEYNEMMNWIGNDNK